MSLAARINWMQQHCSVQNKSKGPPVPLRFSPIQIDFLRRTRAWHLDGTQDICVKPRQIGLTTINLAYICALLILEPGLVSLVICQDDDNAKAVRRKFTIIYESCCKSPGSGFRESMITVNNPNAFELSNGSKVIFLWAGEQKKKADKTGRGDTFHFGVFTEVAFWDNPRTIYRTVRPAIEKARPSIVWDSTPNGTVGNGEMFYRRAMKAMTGASRDNFMFWAWFEDPDYVRPVRQKLIYTPMEMQWIDKYKLTDEQITWWREQVEEYDGDVEATLEIYPVNIEQAFRPPGNSVFDKDVLRKTTSRIIVNGVNINKSSIEDIGRDCQYYSGYDVLMNVDSMQGRGYFRLFERIQRGKQYMIGVDTSEGSKDSDFQCAQIIDVEADSVGILRGRLPIIEFAWILQAIAHYLYMVSGVECLVFIEDKSTGPQLAGYLSNEVSASEVQKHNVSPILTMQYESVFLVKNNFATRPIMIAMLIQYINKEVFNIKDQETLSEACSLEKKNDKIEAANGANDDIMLATAIALRGRELHLGRNIESELQFTSDGASNAERFKYIPTGNNLHTSAIGNAATNINSNSWGIQPSRGNVSGGESRGIFFED